MVVVDVSSGTADVIETVGSVLLAGLAFAGFGGGGAALAFLRAGADFAIDSHRQMSSIFPEEGVLETRGHAFFCCVASNFFLHMRGPTCPLGLGFRAVVVVNPVVVVVVRSLGTAANPAVVGVIVVFVIVSILIPTAFLFRYHLGNEFIAQSLLFFFRQHG